jgi:ABC-type branched-subunit amino acid transport system ATPase component
MKQNMQKINSLNIYQALEYVHQLFGDPAFKDRLLLEFITLTLKIRDKDQQKERGYQIALSLFDLFHDLKGSIEKQSTKLSKGNEEDAKLARKLR